MEGSEQEMLSTPLIEEVTLGNGAIIARGRNNDDDSSSGFYEDAVWFGCGMGSSICYIATLSSLVYFMMTYGPDSFVYLNLAVYLPSVPISLAQAKYDHEFDREFGSYRTYFFRGVVGFIFSILGTCIILHSKSQALVILAAIMQGLGGSVLLGILNQMASFVSSSGRSKAAVSTGVQASALVVLAVSLITGFGSSDDDSMLGTFFSIIIYLECFFLGVFALLMMSTRSVYASMIRRDINSSSSRNSLLVDNDNDNENDDEDENDPTSRQLSDNEQYYEIFERTKYCCIILVITLVPSFLVGSWFTIIETDWMRLPQILFYTRIGADLCGRIATIARPPASVEALGMLAGLRLIPVAFFFHNSMHVNATLPIHDVLSIILVAIIAFLSGYLVTGCFQLAPALLGSDAQDDSKLSRQASLLNVAFSFAALGGLLSSFALVAAGF